jgi:hypothetical protein
VPPAGAGAGGTSIRLILKSSCGAVALEADVCPSGVSATARATVPKAPNSATTATTRFTRRAVPDKARRFRQQRRAAPPALRLHGLAQKPVYRHRFIPSVGQSRSTRIGLRPEQNAPLGRRAIVQRYPPIAAANWLTIWHL